MKKVYFAFLILMGCSNLSAEEWTEVYDVAAMSTGMTVYLSSDMTAEKNGLKIVKLKTIDSDPEVRFNRWVKAEINCTDKTIRVREFALLRSDNGKEEVAVSNNEPTFHPIPVATAEDVAYRKACQ